MNSSPKQEQLFHQWNLLQGHLFGHISNPQILSLTTLGRLIWFTEAKIPKMNKHYPSKINNKKIVRCSKSVNCSFSTTDHWKTIFQVFQISARTIWGQHAFFFLITWLTISFRSCSWICANSCGVIMEHRTKSCGMIMKEQIVCRVFCK